MPTTRPRARPARAAGVLALVPVLLVGGAAGAGAQPEAPPSVVSSPLPVGEPSRAPSPTPTPAPRPAGDTASQGDPLVRLVLGAVAVGVLLGVAGVVGLYLTRKSRGAHG